MIRIVCVGKIKKDWEGIQEHYLRMISKYVKLEIIEIKEGKGNSRKEVLKKEKKELKKYVKGKLYVLDVSGSLVSSEEFAKLMDGEITFLIGGKFGIHEDLKNKGKIISLSPLTFSHQLVRIVLLEQIYRWIAVKRNLPFVG